MRYSLNVCVVSVGLSWDLLVLIKTFVRSIKKGVIGLVVQKDSQVRVVAVEIFVLTVYKFDPPLIAVCACHRYGRAW